MPIISSMLHSLRCASQVSKRVLLGFKKSGKKSQKSSSEAQKTCSSHPASKTEPAHVEKPVLFTESENYSVCLFPVVPQASLGTSDYSTTSLLSSKRKMSTESSLTETSSAASGSQYGHPSIFSLVCQNDSQVPSPASSIGTSPSLLDSENLTPVPKKRFIRIQQPVRDCQPNYGFSVHQDYYYDYLPQFEEVTEYTPCQSDTLRSVFEDDSDDEQEDKRAAPKKRKYFLKKDSSESS